MTTEGEAPARTYRAVVVDDAADVRVLVGLTLTRSGLFTVVGEGASGREALDLVATHRPDMVLLDVSMPGMDGLEALPRILSASPDTAVVMLSGFASRDLAAAAVGMGATGYVSKELPLGELPDRLVALLTDGPVEPRPEPSPAPPSEPVAEVTELEAAQTVLSEHLERFRMAFDQAAIGMTSLTLGRRIVRANDAFAELVGRSEEDLVGRLIDELVHPDHRAHLSSRLGEIVANELRTDRTELRIVTGGSPRWVTLTATAVHDRGGRPLYLFVQALDVTGHKRTEHALRRLEQRYADAILQLDAVVAVTDTELVHTFVSPRVYEMWGYEPESLLGRSALELVHGDDIVAARTQLTGGAPNPQMLTYRVRCSDGHHTPVTATVTPVPDPETGDVVEHHWVVRPR